MSFTRMFRIFAAVAMLAALGSCKVNTINSFPVNPANLRYGNFMSNAPTVNVQVQGVTAWSGVPFQTLTDYQQFKNQQTSFAVYAPDITPVIAESSASLSAKTTYGLIGYGTLQNPSLLFQVDDAPDIGSGNTQLRVTDLGYGFGAIDVYITAPGVPLVGSSPTYSMGLGGNTSFQTFTAGMYQIRVTISGTTTLLFDSGPIDLALNASQGIYLYGVTATHSFSAILGSVVTSTSTPVPSTVGAIKMVNAAYQAGNVDLKVDGVFTFQNLPYNTATASYVPILAGSRVLTFDASTAPTIPIAESTTTFGPSTDYTVMVSGANGSEVVSTFQDYNTPPTSTVSRVRVINGSPDVPAFDVAVDDTVVATNVAYTQASLFFDVSSGNHTIKLLAPGTTTPIYTVDSRAYGGNTVISIYLTGPASALKQLVTQDNL